jgi:hypothetical protein
VILAILAALLEGVEYQLEPGTPCGPRSDRTRPPAIGASFGLKTLHAFAPGPKGFFCILHDQHAEKSPELGVKYFVFKQKTAEMPHLFRQTRNVRVL